ncbi:hypothetical protein Nepgr_015204 [Nepenthes gracilis]|uniref:WAT1-related protein n=1 Tax=Nepenthes gracilis TaxID=150966 RepID=A0AAD3XQI7_NEPGR|nr:hypothetical protein Nepgr_015204 [Nepenthes gracilis]
MEGRYWFKDVLPVTVMVAMECTNVGLNTLFKAATMRGMSHYVFIVYSYAIAAFVLLPSTFLYRKTVLPPLSFCILSKLFLLGLIGSSALMLGYKGIQYSSPTLASALSNLIPAFTFIFAVILRMEKLAWRTSSSQAKILGTVVSIAGALLVILYKGPAITFSSTKNSMSFHDFLSTSKSSWVVGGLLLASEYILTPIWYIVQAQIIKEYPAEFLVVFFYSLFGAIISALIAFVAETEASAWRLKLDISLAAVLYSGLLGSFLGNSVHAWVLRRKGPVYVAMFKPLSIAIAATMGMIFLGDTPHLGSIVGATVITFGFYTVMWGKATEEMREDLKTGDLESSSQNTPLLHASKVDSGG